MEKQRTLYQQARLHDRGAAEMVLQMISASKGNVERRTEIHIVNLSCIMLYIYIYIFTYIYILYIFVCIFIYMYVNTYIFTHMRNTLYISYTTFYLYDIYVISDLYMTHYAAK